MVALGAHRRHHAAPIWIALFAIWNLQPAISSAQTGDCPRSLGEAYLDAGNVRARILNTGGLFYRGEPHVYEVPKGSGSNAIFAADIWITGRIDGQIRAAGSRYGEWEFWAGPLDEAGNPPADCRLYDRIWEIRIEDLETFDESRFVSDNLRDWPWRLGAPVVDGDGDSSNYNLAGGDRPQLFGDQRLWWIMNDRGNVHSSTGSEPIGLEVHASAHAFNHPGFAGNTTFYRYRLINKNTSPLTDAYFSLFTDIDLGDFSDDFVGSDSLFHLGYGYNADNEDLHREGYGTPPPAIGFSFIESAVVDSDDRDNDRDGSVDEPGEMIGTSSVMFFNSGGGVTEDPQSAVDMHNYARAHWKDGTRLLMGWFGYHDGFPRSLPRVPTNFFFPGDPVTGSFWSEMNIDRMGTALTTGDRRLITSSGPFNIEVGDTLGISFAIVWSVGKNHLDSVTELKKDVAAIRDAADFFLNSLNPYRQKKPSSSPASRVLGLDQNYPNPFSSSTAFRYSLPEALPVRLAVFDVLGREIEVLTEAYQPAGVYTVDFDGSRLPSGIYYARIEMGQLRFTKKMVLVR